MSETRNAEIAATPWDSLDPAAHCFREDNCVHHAGHLGPRCCCCGYPHETHSGCDCD